MTFPVLRPRALTVAGVLALAFTASSAAEAQTTGACETPQLRSKPVNIARSTSASVGDFPHAIAASSNHAYALSQTFPAAGGSKLSLSHSADGGVTWGAPVTFATVGAGFTHNGASVAVDAGNPSQVYVVYQRNFSTGGQSSTQTGDLNFVTSADAGATFSVPVALAGGNSIDSHDPDVVSPSAGVAMVAATTTANLNAGGAVLVWRLGPNGAALTTAAGIAPGIVAPYVPFAKMFVAPTGTLFDTNNGRFGPHLATANGKVCVALTAKAFGSGTPGAYLHCTGNGSSTEWDLPTNPLAKTNYLVAVALPGSQPERVTRARITMDPRPGKEALALTFHRETDVGTASHSYVKVLPSAKEGWSAEVRVPAPQDPDTGTTARVTDEEVLYDAQGNLWHAHTVLTAQRRVSFTPFCGIVAGASVEPSFGGTSVANPLLFQSGAGTFAGANRIDGATNGPSVLRIGR